MNISRQKVFVTGGSGFVGRELMAALKAKGCQTGSLPFRTPQAKRVVQMPLGEYLSACKQSGQQPNEPLLAGAIQFLKRDSSIA